ncbi:phospholipase/Carboxylesterase domain-containing protein [Ditylenchus destructor]|nr:phospholipase/Carboxylesterase domain-containing protein [Ditylenchus destructor]
MGSTSNVGDALASFVTRQPIILPASGNQTATVIFFHGLGDQGDGWAQILNTELNLDYIKFIVPHAANRRVTLNFGAMMPAWYDIFGLTATSCEDDAGIELAKKYVHSLIDAEVAAGTPSKRIILGGFSMGGALALYAGLTYKEPLGCLISMSGFLLQRTRLPGEHKANINTPIFLGHGSEDPLVQFPFAEATFKALKIFNPNVQLKSYPIGHSSHPQEHADITNFIKTHVPPS